VQGENDVHGYSYLIKRVCFGKQLKPKALGWLRLSVEKKGEGKMIISLKDVKAIATPGLYRLRQITSKEIFSTLKNIDGSVLYYWDSSPKDHLLEFLSRQTGLEKELFKKGLVPSKNWENISSIAAEFVEADISFASLFKTQKALESEIVDYCTRNKTRYVFAEGDRLRFDVDAIATKLSIFIFLIPSILPAGDKGYSVKRITQLLKQEYGPMSDRINIHDLSIKQATDKTNADIAKPGVYVFWEAPNSVIKVGKHFQNCRKRALEHINDNTADEMKSFNEKSSVRLLLFTVESGNDLHLVSGLETFFETRLQPIIRSRRIG